MTSRRIKCNGHSKRTGKPCQAWSMANGACYMHGGNTPRGLESVHTKTGYYSKHMPTKYAARQEELEAAQDLKDMNKDVGLMTNRILSLSEKIDVGDYGSSYKKLQSLYAHCDTYLESILASSDSKAAQSFADYFSEIGMVIERGADDYTLWQEIAERVHDRRQIISEISKIEYRGQKAVTLETLMMLMGKLAEHFNRVNVIEDANERRQAFRDGQDSLLRLVE